MHPRHPVGKFGSVKDPQIVIPCPPILESVPYITIGVTDKIPINPREPYTFPVTHVYFPPNEDPLGTSDYGSIYFHCGPVFPLHPPPPPPKPIYPRPDTDSRKLQILRNLSIDGGALSFVATNYLGTRMQVSGCNSTVLYETCMGTGTVEFVDEFVEPGPTVVVSPLKTAIMTQLLNFHRKFCTDVVPKDDPAGIRDPSRTVDWILDPRFLNAIHVIRIKIKFFNGKIHNPAAVPPHHVMTVVDEEDETEDNDVEHTNLGKRPRDGVGPVEGEPALKRQKT